MNSSAHSHRTTGESPSKVMSFAGRWAASGGYRQLISVAFPLIMSTASWSVQHFVDRMFLSWYSSEALAAAMPAGILNFTFVSLFLGLGSYTNTFVAQYHGAGRPQRIGPAIWQGVWVALFAAALHLLLIPLAPRAFRAIGHNQAIQHFEIAYFQVLCLGTAPFVASAALSGFFAGRGKTWPVMWVNLSITCVNIVLDYALVFGKWGLPEMGIRGAGLATVLSATFGFLVYLTILSQERFRKTYRTFSIGLEKSLFGRLLRFGLPSGIQFFLDIAGFSAFVLLVGRLGMIQLAATNIAFNVNTLAFMPMIGLGIGVSMLVGQNLGRNDPQTAERATYSGFHLALLYMCTIATLYVLTPGLFLAPYSLRADPIEFEKIRPLAVLLLRFVALYSIFDSMTIVFSASIKGAGDTRFVMLAILIMSSLLLVLPVYLATQVYGAGIFAAFGIATGYVSLLGFVCYARFRTGKWRKMRVIEELSGSV